jgi:tetratricopeptide (TPR) repeat protein
MTQKKNDRHHILVLAATILLACPGAIAASKFDQYSNDAEAAYKNRNYPEAQKFFELAIKEAADKLDKNDKRVAMTFYNLALVFQAEGNYAEAEKNMLKALDLNRGFYGAEHQRVAQVYMDLADLYVEQSQQDNNAEIKKKAAENYKKGVDIYEKIYAQATGQEAKPAADPVEKPVKNHDNKSDKASENQKSEKNPAQDAAMDLSNALMVLAESYAGDEAYDQAEPLYKRAVELDEYAYGPESKELAKHQARLAEIYCVDNKYKLAEPVFQAALATSEKANGANAQETAQILYNYGGMHYDQGEFPDAEVKFKRALKIFSANPEMKPLDVALKRISLGDVLDMQNKAEEAQTVYKEIEPVVEKGDDKGALVAYLKQYRKHLLMQNKKEEAAKVSARLKEINSPVSSK